MKGERCGVPMDFFSGVRRRTGYLVVRSAGLFDGPACWWHRLLRCADRRLETILEWDGDATIVPLPVTIDDFDSASTADPGVIDGQVHWCPARRRLRCGDHVSTT